MECFEIKNLSFSYSSRNEKCLKNISLEVKKGEFLTICGRSGCGKTTLLKHLKPTLTPFGEMCGEILFFGENVKDLSFEKECRKIGFVQQNPENMIVTDKVWHELSFGLENLGMPIGEIRRKVSEISSYFGLEGIFRKNVSELSGGQKQILNLASVMVMDPEVLILDEPTSQLDPIAAQEFLELLKRINRELGITVIISEHRTEDVFPISDRVVIMESGEITVVETPGGFADVLKKNDLGIVPILPTAMRVYASVENDFSCPVTVAEGKDWLAKMLETRKAVIPESSDKKKKSSGDCAIKLDEVFFRYEKDGEDVLENLSLEIQSGEVFGIVGGNGAGKTTLLSVICGIRKPYRGKMNVADGLIVGMLPQDPQSLFLEKTVEDDLLGVFDGYSTSKEQKKEEIIRIAKLCEIEHILNQHPYDLSGGEQQRAALAKILLVSPDIILMDEPTKGMDAFFKKRFGGILKSLKKAGKTVVVVSHDIEFCAEYTDRCGMVFDKTIINADNTRGFFVANSFYTTAATRMSKNLMRNVVLAEDITEAFGTGEQKEQDDSAGEDLNKSDIIEESFLPKRKKQDVNIMPQQSVPAKKHSGCNRIALVILLIAVPLTVFVGNSYFGDRKYYLISILIILEVLLAFFAVFETRKPRAAEVVTISVLCAVGVAGRIVFAAVPQVKPLMAIVIISGVSLGGESGFLVGAISGFVSNLYFGQGPWTPWQMLAFGLAGFIAGFLTRNGFMSKKRFGLCVYGAVSAIGIYGVIMNVSSIFMMHQQFSWNLAASYIAMGLPFDLIHASSTVAFLWLVALPMIEKIERIKNKYGIMR